MRFVAKFGVSGALFVFQITCNTIEAYSSSRGVVTAEAPQRIALCTTKQWKETP